MSDPAIVDPAATRGRARGRYEIVCVWPSGGFLRITSQKGRSLSPLEIVAGLREYADIIERGIEAHVGVAKKADG